LYRSPTGGKNSERDIMEDTRRPESCPRGEIVYWKHQRGRSNRKTVIALVST